MTPIGGPDAGREHLDPVDDRLGEDVPPAGHLERRAHLLDQVVLRLLPEEEPVGERLLERGPRAACSSSGVASRSSELPLARRASSSSSSAAQVPTPTARSKSSQLSAFDPLLEPLARAPATRRSVIRVKSVVRRAAEDVADGVGGPLQRLGRGREQVGPVARGRPARRAAARRPSTSAVTSSSRGSSASRSP